MLVVRTTERRRIAHSCGGARRPGKVLDGGVARGAGRGVLDDGAGDGEFVGGRRGRGAGGGDEGLEDGVLASPVKT